MRARVENQKYRSVSEFQSDFDLIISNCMTYNAKETIYYSAAVKLSDQVGCLLQFWMSLMQIKELI